MHYETSVCTAVQAGFIKIALMTLTPSFKDVLLIPVYLHLILKAIKKEQQRVLDDMKLRHDEEAQNMKEKLNKELKKDEDAALNEFDAETERHMREIKDRHAAEISARSDAMSPEELQQVEFFAFLIYFHLSIFLYPYPIVSLPFVSILSPASDYCFVQFCQSLEFPSSNYVLFLNWTA